MPPWWRSKHSPFGVMMPSSSCSGVKLTEDSGVAVSQGTVRRIDVLFVFRRIAVGAHADAVAELARPVRHVRRQVLGIVGERAGTLAPAAARPAAPARNRRREALRLVGRLCHRQLPADAFQVRSYHILFHECNSEIALRLRKFSRWCWAQRARSSPPRHSARPVPTPAGLAVPSFTLAQPATDVFLFRLDRLAGFQMRHGRNALADRL